MASADDPWALLGTLPPTIDAAAVIDRAGERLWDEPSGRLIRAALSGTGLFSQTERAWAGLSNALGYTEAEAAAALLGGRVVVVWDGLSRDDGTGAIGAAARADTRWAMVAELDRDTARSVRARLKASPRRTTGGRVIYSLDAGRLVMALSDPPPDANGADRARTRVVIAPERATELAGALVSPARANRNPDHGPSLGEQARAMLGNVEPGWAAVAVLRPADAAGPSVVEFRSAGEAWGVRFALPAWSRTTRAGVPIGVLGAFREDALLAAAFADGPRFEPAGLSLMLSAGGDDQDRAVHTEAGSVVLIRTQPGADNKPVLISQLITHARTREPFAESMDRMVSAMLGGENPPDHRGAFPGAVRTHTLAPSPARPARSWPGEHARVAWCLSPDGADRAGVISMAMAPAGSDPSTAARAGRDAWERLAGDHDPTMITAGLAHPPALIEAFMPEAPGPLGSMARAVERMEWTVRQREDIVRGEILLRFAPARARLGGS